MKILYCLLVLCGLAIVSCQKDAQIFENETTLVNSTSRIQENEAINEVGENTPEPQNPNTGPTRLTEAQVFEQKMAWTSYIASKIIYSHAYDTSFKDSLRALINNRAVALGDLIGPNSQFQDFDDEFKILLAGYIENIWCPDAEEETPNWIIISNPPNTKTATTSQLVDFYLDFVLSQNCIELYFPVGVQAGQVNTVSIAHPLTNDYANGGFERSGSGCAGSTLPIWVVPNYIMTNNTSITFIVARPFRTVGLDSCTYPEYGTVDFTQFFGSNF